MMEKELKKELELRGTAEVIGEVVTQVTQAIDETTDSVKMLVFGEMVENKIKPIEECCAVCNKWQTHRFDNVAQCQERQKRDAEARGFTEIICPTQFKDS